jgi:hypothetical protein
MASIRKLASGKYLYRWRVDGKQPSKTFDRRIDAERFARQIEASKDRGEYIDPQGARITLSEWVNQWHAGRLNLRPSTQARDAIYIDRYINGHLGQKQLRHTPPKSSAPGSPPSTKPTPPPPPGRHFNSSPPALNKPSPTA